MHQQDIERIEGLGQLCRQLEILYLQNNLISKIGKPSLLAGPVPAVRFFPQAPAAALAAREVGAQLLPRCLADMGVHGWCRESGAPQGAELPQLGRQQHHAGQRQAPLSRPPHSCALLARLECIDARWQQRTSLPIAPPADDIAAVCASLLSLTHCRACVQIEGLERCESLRKLDLTVNFVDKAGLLTVQRLRANAALREL